MLRRTPSLALRAALIFVSIYALIFATVVAVALYSQSADRSSDQYRGAYAAMRFTAAELDLTSNGFKVPADGYVQRLAARNPGMWVIAEREGSRAVFGRPPASAISFVEQYGRIVDSVRFQVPGQPTPLGAASIRQFDFLAGKMMVAAGGVDPATLNIRDSLRLFGADDALFALIVIGCIGFLPMLVAAPLFGRALRPLAAQAASLNPEDRHSRIDEKKAPREVLPLVRAVNGTLDRLAAELARRKRFITDAAHELRTPLAVLSLRVEALPEGSDRDELKRGMQRITGMVAQMLDLERLALPGGARDPVDLAAVARDVLANLAPMAIKSGYEPTLDAPNRPVIVRGEEAAVARALTNLVANAVEHGGGHGDIRVTVGDGTVEVSDDGPGIPSSLLPDLFEPFTRGNQATTGSGLGLHLTREIMRAHGGSIALAPTPRGACFRLIFPAPAI